MEAYVMLWDVLLCSNRIRGISGYSHLYQRITLMCVFSSAHCVWLLNIGLHMSQSNTSLYVWLSCLLPYWLRLARTGGPIKLTLWVLGLPARNRGKDPFRCCVNHCFISTLLSPSLCSDISQGFWPPFKCEHNTAIEIMAHTSWPEPGSALALQLPPHAQTAITTSNTPFLSYP